MQNATNDCTSAFGTGSDTSDADVLDAEIVRLLLTVE